VLEAKPWRPGEVLGQPDGAALQRALGQEGAGPDGELGAVAVAGGLAGGMIEPTRRWAHTRSCKARGCSLVMTGNLVKDKS